MDRRLWIITDKGVCELNAFRKKKIATASELNY